MSTNQDSHVNYNTTIQFQDYHVMEVVNFDPRPIWTQSVYLFAWQDCYDPPIVAVFADSYEESLEIFLETNYGKSNMVDELDQQDYKEDQLFWHEGYCFDLEWLWSKGVGVYNPNTMVVRRNNKVPVTEFVRNSQAEVKQRLRDVICEVQNSVPQDEVEFYKIGLGLTPDYQWHIATWQFEDKHNQPKEEQFLMLEKAYIEIDEIDEAESAEWLINRIWENMVNDQNFPEWITVTNTK